MPERQLSWQLGFSLSRKPTKRAAPRRNIQQGFEFVMEYPQRSYRRARCSPSETATGNARPPSSSSPRETGNSIVATTHRAQFQNELVEEEDHESPIDGYPSPFEALENQSPVSSEPSPDQDTTDGTKEVCSSPWQAGGQAGSQAGGQASNSPEPMAADERNVGGSSSNADERSTGSSSQVNDVRNVDSSSQSAAALTALTRAPYPNPPPLLPVMEYSSLTERFRPILTRCNASCCSHPHSSGLSS